MASAWSPKPLRSGSIPERPAHVVLASRTANAGRKPKRSSVEVRETTPFFMLRARQSAAPSRSNPGGAPPFSTGFMVRSHGAAPIAQSRADHLVVMAVSYAARGPVRFRRSRRSSGCGSIWLERAVRDRETGGSNPLTPTLGRAVHLGVKAVLQTARGPVRFRRPLREYGTVAQRLRALG